MKSPKVGNKAPLFTLLNQDGKEIDLKAIKDKTIVLYFYPKASTPGCTVQACGIRDYKKEWAKANVVVFCITPDDPTKIRKII